MSIKKALYVKTKVDIIHSEEKNESSLRTPVNQFGLSMTQVTFRKGNDVKMYTHTHLE